LLWYKAWLETRARFLASLLTLTLFCGLFVHHAVGMMNPAWKVDFNRLVYITQEFLALMWILSAILLGMGGIVHEKMVGTSALTLSLPVSRTRLQFVRVGLGILEAVALGVIPWLTILAVSWHAKMPLLIAQAAFYVVLLVGGGSVYYAIAVLVSSVVEGTYSSPAIAIGLVFLLAVVLDSWFRRLNLWRFVTGSFYLDVHTFLLTGHFPWLGTFLCLGVAALMFVASTMVVLRRDF
jgi:ABC-2 type transport system permease protein